MVPTNIAEVELLRKELQELSQSLASSIQSSSIRLNHAEKDQIYKAPEIDSEKQISNISKSLKMYKIHQEYVKEILNALDVFEDTCFPPDGWIEMHLGTLKKAYPDFFKLHNLSPVLISIEELQRLHSPKMAEVLLKIFDEHPEFNVIPLHKNNSSSEKLENKHKVEPVSRTEDNSVVRFSIVTSPSLSNLRPKTTPTTNTTNELSKTKKTWLTRARKLLNTII